MFASLLCFIAFATSADSLQLPDVKDDTTIPMEGGMQAAMEEVARKQRSTVKGSNGLVRTVHQTGTLSDGNSKELSMVGENQEMKDAEYEELVASERAGCKWMIAILPPLLLVSFVIYVRNAAEKARQAGAKDSWFNSILRVNLIQQALAVAGPEKDTSMRIEESADLGKSLLSEVEEDAIPDCEEAITAASPLLQAVNPQEEEDERDSSAKLFSSLADSLYSDEVDHEEEQEDDSAKLFASLAGSLYSEEMDDEGDLQVLPVDAAMPGIVEDSEWDAFQGAEEVDTL